LRDLLAREYQLQGKDRDAFAIIWEAFEAWPALDTYSRLKRIGEPAGVWAKTRQGALGRLRQATADGISATEKERDPWGPHDHSELVRVLLWDGDPEAALEEARGGGCGQRLWLELAAELERDSAAAALEIYQAQLRPTFVPGGLSNYKEVVELMRRIQRLMQRLGRGAEFAGLVSAIRAEHPRKRNLLKLLDNEGW
jgi:uncharacterized Zn finger protein